MFADLFPQTVDDAGLVQVMVMFTAAVLLVIGIAIAFFAKWSKKEKARRERDVNTAINLKR